MICCPREKRGSRKSHAGLRSAIYSAEMIRLLPEDDDVRTSADVRLVVCVMCSHAIQQKGEVQLRPVIY